ncbi:hypothetical protein CWB41_02010 [Methylovirgula ligni]|uniref:Uncharacterized protein DUF2628 n=1 Tax=Methylovirgula ligni TaxID=569860 RepID=A0A3D9YXN4_9HYPH|nr:DUF2628 domain-containing protein [Methylovirgula ligni]QAY94666.1 hypothetical protein CWB41_02010 [Methylovirgula ligni]REF87452.1 uncharacterized protein DUF2628 [Methylovirgula ligni]
MAVYTVYVPDFGRRAPSEADRYAALPDAVFVREGFSRAAFFLGPFWLAWHRLWGVLIVWFVLFGLLTLVAPQFLGDGAIFWIALLLEFLLGLEGNGLRQRELTQRGFRLSDVAAGIRRIDAERSYFHRALRAIPPPLPQVKISDAATAPARTPHGDIVGLFPHPEDAR